MRRQRGKRFVANVPQKFWLVFFVKKASLLKGLPPPNRYRILTHFSFPVLPGFHGWTLQIGAENA
jgi:hypothetical protein